MARFPWGLVVAAALLLPGVATGGLPLPFAARSPDEAPVEADVAFAQARVAGDLAVEAARGALLVEGAPASFALEARDLVVHVVRVRSDYLDNPLAGDFYVVSDTVREEHRLVDAVVSLAAASPRTVLYAHEDAGAGWFRVDLGPVLGEPLHATAEDAVVVVTERGQSWAFEHTIPAPAFGVAQGMEGPFTAPLRGVEARRDFAVVVDYATLVAQGAQGAPVTVEAGKFRVEQGPRIGPLAPRYVAERVYAVLEVRDGALTLDPSGTAARFLAPEPTYALDGALLLRSASGVLRVGGGAHGVAREALELEGALRIQPRATPGSPLALEPGVRASVTGEARAASLGGRALLQPLPTAVREASLLAVALAALAAGWGALQKGLAPVLLPFYARLSGRDLLSNRHRLRLYGAIRAHPFIHLRELQRATGLGFGTVAYHVALLKRERMVASVRARREERFYVPSRRFSSAAMVHLAALGEPARRRLAQAVLAGTDTQEGLARALGLSRGRVSRHLAVLAASGLVEVHGARGRRYRPSPLLRAWAAEQGLAVGTPRPAGASPRPAAAPVPEAVPAPALS